MDIMNSGHNSFITWTEADLRQERIKEKQMRQYRAIPIDDKNFVYGGYIELEDEHYIIPDTASICYGVTIGTSHYDFIEGFVKVIPETVGQQTGLKDKNGKEIYEDDKIRITAAIDMFNDDGSISMRKDEVYEDAIVSFSNGAFWLGYGCIPEKHLLKMILNDGNWRGEIIGNVHQPELMEQGNG